MGRDLVDSSAPARELFEQADSVLGFSISEVCFEGPEDRLQDTQYAQPALFTTSLACLEAARASEIDIGSPAFVAGHSLGEYTALVAAGALSFADGLRLVQERGRLMQQAGEARPGAMAAILGLQEDAVAAICRDAGAELCNFNAPGQIVVGGAVEAVEAAMSLALERGARRGVRLNVSGAFHTSFMQPAVDGMRAAVADSAFKDADIPVVANTSGEPVASANELRDELIKQLAQPVQWQRSVEFMANQGVDRVIEFGPGRVLTGLVRRIDKSISATNVSSMADLTAA